MRRKDEIKKIIMFSVSEETCLSSKSSWQKEMPLSSRGTQTEPYKQIESSTQHPLISSAGTQSSSCAYNRRAGGGDWLTSDDDDDDQTKCTDPLGTHGNLSNDPIDLQAFLTRAAAITIQEIQESCRINENWDILNRLFSKSEEKAEQVFSIHSDQLTAGLGGEGEEDIHDLEGYRVTDIKWNCTSSMVAISYGAGSNKIWTPHSSYLLLWSLYGSFDGKSSHPSYVLEVDSCISVLCPHPHHSTVYAVGTLSGKILVLNSRYAGRGFSHPASTGSGNYVRSLNPPNLYHEDQVTCIHWMMPGKRKEKNQLISFSLDGRIFMWSAEMNMENPHDHEAGSEPTTSTSSESYLTLLQVFVIRIQDLPKSLGIRSSSASSSSSEVGIVCASFSSDDPFNFIIGCHGGAVFLCSLDSPDSSRSNSINGLTLGSEFLMDVSSSSLSSPIRVAYAPHRYNVVSVQFCPASRSLFLSASSDGELRIYNMLDVKPLAVVHSEADMISASWSPSRKTKGGPTLLYFYCLLRNGLLGRFFYNPKEEKVPLSPSFFLPHSDALDHEFSIFSMNFCEASGGEQVAVASVRGDISIWQLKY